MKKEEKTNKTELEVKIKIEGDAFKEAKEKAFNKVIKDVKIDGFRKGKAPRNVYEKKYGTSAIMMEAVDIILPEASKKLFEENNYEIVATPSVDVSDLTDDYVEFTFHLTLKPEVKVKKYKKLGVKKEEIKVTKEEIEHEITHMQEHYAEISLKEGKITTGDIAIIDFKGFKDDVAFEGGTGENYSLEIGSNTFIPGFEDALIGLSKGDEKDVLLTFPEDYANEELKGQKVVFKVKINEVKTKVIPELNKEFYDDLAIEGVDSKETLEAYISDNIKARKEYDNDNAYIDKLLDRLIEETEVEVPQAMLDDELKRMIGQFTEQLKMQGVDINYFYQVTSSDEEGLKAQMTGEAIKRIKSRLALEEIAVLEKIEISDEDANKEAEELAKKYNMEKDEFLKLFGGLEMVKYDSKMRLAMEVLKEE